jgi:glycosyltransferase involved in cell wall biosynthesis
VSFKDIHIFRLDVLANMPVPWVPLVPIDTEPPSMAVVQRLQFAHRPIVLTQQAFDALLAIGAPRPYYAPHGIDTNFWTPGDKREARATLGLPSDAFVVAFVGANQSVPSRKGLDKAIQAFAMFQQHDATTTCEHQDAMLYLHTMLNQQRQGLNIYALLDFFNIDKMNWMATPQLQMIGGVPREYLRNVYRAADVLLNPATGGATEICQLEAQACGTPVISSDFTAMRETAWAGWRVGSDERDIYDDVELEPGQMGMRYRPRPSRILRSLEAAYRNRDNTELQQQARDGALKYHLDAVLDEYWLPLFKRLERDLSREKAA